LNNVNQNLYNDVINYIQYLIIDWGKLNFRDYPWRITDNQFHILIAEIFLQRTKAEQVLKMYNEFCSKYITPLDVIKVSKNDFINQFISLGLLWRIENVHDLSNILVNKYNGIIPSSYENLLNLPGVGQYIASAYIIITQNKRTPLLDANFVRLISRIFNLKITDNSRRDKNYQNIIFNLLTENNPKLMFFALLDYTYFICKKRHPSCKNCIIQNLCSYYFIKTYNIR